MTQAVPSQQIHSLGTAAATFLFVETFTISPRAWRYHLIRAADTTLEQGSATTEMTFWG